jgi:small subunit ribosomal protein S2
LVRQLIDAGIHFGHRASRWNPKMAPYIFGKRNTIHIIDIRETVKGLLRAKRFVAQTVARGKDVLFVGTKRQARLQVEQQAKRVGMPCVTERWLGGTLTNFRTIRSRLARLEELEAAESDGTALEYSKKMIATRARELRKIRRNLEGIREMNKLPGALIVIDVHREHNAVREAKKLGIPTICLIDTDSDPDYADVPIPGNDDAIRSVETVLVHLADAVEEGLKGRTAPEPEGAAPEPRERRRRFVAAAGEQGIPTEQAVPQGERAQAPASETPPAAPDEQTRVVGGPADKPDGDMTPATATDPEGH